MLQILAMLHIDNLEANNDLELEASSTISGFHPRGLTRKSASTKNIIKAPSSPPRAEEETSTPFFGDSGGTFLLQHNPPVLKKKVPLEEEEGNLKSVLSTL